MLCPKLSKMSFFFFSFLGLHNMLRHSETAVILLDHKIRAKCFPVLYSCDLPVGSLMWHTFVEACILPVTVLGIGGAESGVRVCYTKGPARNRRKTDVPH